MTGIRHRPLRRLVLSAAIVLTGAGCERLLVEPAPGPGMISLALSPSGPDFAVAPASANRVRVQVFSGGVLLDSVFPFDPEKDELLVPVRFAGTEASAALLVEIGEDGLPLLQGSTEILLRQRRVTEVAVELHAANVFPLPPARELATGVYHSCATTVGVIGAQLFCWGNNDGGQLGSGRSTTSSLPVFLEGSRGMYGIAAGFLTTCGLAFEGAAFCWGDNEFGSLGSGASPARSAVPVPVDGDIGFSSLTVGGLHACGVSFGGAAYCWGFNGFGQLGDGTTTNRSTPVRVAGETSFRSLSAGYIHTCGITTGGQTLCWGLNEFGQLGDGGAADRLVPGPVAGEQRFTEVSAGGLHTCALTESGEAYCWGFNDFGQLGTGSTEPLLLPATVGPSRFTTLSSGGLHTCGITTDGSAHCWGYNRSGALGDNTLEDRSTPVEVTGGFTFDVIRSGLHHTCGTVRQGQVVCWGYNRFGQLGDGSRFDRSTPDEVLYGDTFFWESGAGQEELNEAVAALLRGTLLR